MFEKMLIGALMVFALLSGFAIGKLNRLWEEACAKLIRRHEEERAEWIRERKELLSRINGNT